MARILLIVNPIAGRTTERVLHAVHERIQRAGWTVDVARTAGSSDPRRLAEEGVAAGMDAIAVLGGDGTTMRAAAALVGTQIPLGMIPGGTGNILAGNLRIPRSPLEAADVLVSGSRRSVDLGRVGRPDGDHFFAVAAGAGVDAQVMAATPAASKRRWGMAAYIWEALRLVSEFRTRSYEIILDGDRLQTDATMVLVANCGEVFPPHLKMGPDVALDDGWFHVAIVRATGLWQALRVVWQVVRQHQTTLPPGLLDFHKARHVTVTANPGQAVQLDGDPCGATPFSAVIVPAAIQVLAPPVSKTR